MSGKRIEKIKMPCPKGEVIATRNTSGTWTINYPWGSEQYSGRPFEVRDRIKVVLKGDKP